MDFVKRFTQKNFAIQMEEMYYCGIHKTLLKLPHRMTPPLSYTLFPPFCLVSTVLLPSGWNFSPPLRKYLVDCPTQLICSWIFICWWLIAPLNLSVVGFCLWSMTKAKRTQHGNLLGNIPLFLSYTLSVFVTNPNFGTFVITHCSQIGTWDNPC